MRRLGFHGRASPWSSTSELPVEFSGWRFVRSALGITALSAFILPEMHPATAADVTDSLRRMDDNIALMDTRAEAPDRLQSEKFKLRP